MGAFTVTSVIGCATGDMGRGKSVVLTATGPASYDAGGSIIDLSSANTVLTGFVSDAAFVRVTGLKQVGVGAAAADRYYCQYVPGSSGAPATGKVKVRDADDATAMSEVAGATDLSTVTFTFEITGA